MAVVATAILIAGCADPTGGDDVVAGTDGPAPSMRDVRSVGTADLDTADLDTADLDTAVRPVTVESVDLELVATFESAVDVVHHPLDGSMHVVEHAGRVVRLDGDGDAVVVLDITDRLVGHDDEQGLTGLEFAADGRHAWIHHTPADGATVVSEVAVDADGRFDVGSERVLIDIGGPPGNNHNGGDLLLRDDGTLLIAIGDGEAAIRVEGEAPIPTDDPHRHASDPTELRGSILRVRPTPDDAEPYAIPDDNPFADGALTLDDGTEVAGAPEVLAWGLRNPWKIAVDQPSGTLWIADVGSASAEELNAVAPRDGRPAGWAADFGWSAFEGTDRRDADVTPAGSDPVDPVHVYDHADGRCAVSGGEVYRGDDVEGLRGGYVFADFCAGSVWVLDPTTGEERRIAEGIPGISAVRAGPDGELHVASWFGEVHRIVPA